MTAPIGKMTMSTIAPAHVAFERILVPIDFSGVSQSALAYAKNIARQYQSHLFLVHVNQPINLIMPPEAVWIEEGGIQRQLEEQLEQAGAALRSEGFRAKALSVGGTIQSEILSLIKKNKVDLLVMGTHGRKGLDRFLFGSDAEAVLRDVECPVLVIGPQVVPATNQKWHPRRLICATTFNPNSAWIAAYAYNLSVQFQAEFMLINVENPAQPRASEDWPLFEKEFKKNLAGGISSNNAVPTLLSDSLPAHKIVDVAKEGNADLIVVGIRTASTMASHLAPGTAPQVLTESPCPVLTLHQK
jgi:nucleotide-binding universal stress UspA family protein